MIDDTTDTDLIFDIETAPLADAAEYLEPASAPANYKDPEKIAAYIAEKNRDALAKAALDPDLCRIVAIAVTGHYNVSSLIGEGHQVRICTTPDEEADALSWFWETARRARLIGFNCLDFDCPVLLRRSLYLNITPTITVSDLNKYRMGKVVDLMQVLAFGGKLKYRSLAFYCRRLGITVKDEINGSDIGGLVEAGDWDGVESHVRADAEKTRRLARRMGICGTPTINAGYGVLAVTA